MERTFLRLTAPVAQGVTSFFENAEGLFDSFRLAGALQEENRQLRQDAEILRRQLIRLYRVEEELERLSRTSQYERFDTGEFFVADVVYVDNRSWFRTLVLYTGRNQAKHNQPVVTEQGLVGRIVVATEQYAKVLLLTDRAASASAMIQTTRRRGLIRGHGESLLLDNIPLLEKVEPGDQVLTAGIDGVFPRGIPLGEVARVRQGPGLFHQIEVTPAVDVGMLDQVFVLTEETLPSEIRDAVPGSDS